MNETALTTDHGAQIVTIGRVLRFERGGKLVRLADICIAPEVYATLTGRVSRLTQYIATIRRSDRVADVEHYEQRLSVLQELTERLGELIELSGLSGIDDIWLREPEARQIRGALDLANDLIKEFVKAASCAGSYTRLKTAVGSVSSLSVEKRRLYPVAGARAEASMPPLHQIIAYAADPAQEHERWRALLHQAKSALEQGNVTLSKMHLEAIGDPNSLHKSVGKAIELHLVLQGCV